MLLKKKTNFAEIVSEKVAVNGDASIYYYYICLFRITYIVIYYKKYFIIFFLIIYILLYYINYKGLNEA